MADENDEREWIRLSQQGQEEAFTMLVRRHQRMVHSMTYRMTGSLAEAEDLAQETFTQAWHHLCSFENRSKFSSWLCRIAMNVCLNWRKREDRRHAVHRSWANETPSIVHEAAPGVKTDDRHYKVRAALSRLPPKQQAAILLTVYEGKDHAEAAQILGCTVATVSWRVFAARTKLKRWLRKEGSDE